VKRLGICRAATNVCDVAERCNGITPDCPVDVVAPDGTSCDDGDACTGADVCRAGECTHAPPTCGPCEHCDSASGCIVGPRLDCEPSPLGEKSALTIRNHTVDTRDRLDWRWAAKHGTAAAEFGDPQHGTTYGFCVFRENDLVFRAVAPAGGRCGSRDCWRPIGQSGHSYSDAGATPDGLSVLRLRSRGSNTWLTLRGRGPLLSHRDHGLPDLPLHLPLTAQLQAGGRCWQARYSGFGSLKNTPTLFDADSD
jgi:hypothetical protein